MAGAKAGRDGEMRFAMMRLSVLTMLAALSFAAPAAAQVATPFGAPSPLGIASPLGIGPGASVAPTGIPLGATQLGTPGISPALPGTTPMDPITGSTMACGGTSSLTSGVPSPTALFDAGVSAGTASGTCAAGAALARPTASASSPTGMGAAAAGRVGIPMGSVELDPGGLSPPPDTTTVTVPPLMSPLAPTTTITTPGFATPGLTASGPASLMPPTASTLTVPGQTPCPNTGMPSPTGSC